MTHSYPHGILSRIGEKISLLEVIPKNIEIHGIIQFNSGTVIKKEFYLKFANYLANQGYIVLLFDYRGVGASRSKSLKTSSASISSWGIEDAPAVTDWIRNKYPTNKIHLVAHSMGGQILGLMDNWSVFDKIILLASSSGNWNNFKTSLRRKVSLSTNLFFPICLYSFGFVPGRFGLGQDWPKGVANEWWDNSKNNRTMAESMKLTQKTTEYDNIDRTIHAIFFEDDPMATLRTIPNIARSYPSAKIITTLIRPKEYGLKEIGHFGIFKSRNHDALASIVLDRLRQEN